MKNTSQLVRKVTFNDRHYQIHRDALGRYEVIRLGVIKAYAKSEEEAVRKAEELSK